MLGGGGRAGLAASLALSEHHLLVFAERALRGVLSTFAIARLGFAIAGACDVAVALALACVAEQAAGLCTATLEVGRGGGFLGCWLLGVALWWATRRLGKRKGICKLELCRRIAGRRRVGCLADAEVVDVLFGPILDVAEATVGVVDEHSVCVELVLQAAW